MTSRWFVMLTWLTAVQARRSREALKGSMRSNNVAHR